MHVVFGAAGALGAAIVQNLAQQNKAVRAVVRDVGRARKVLPSSAEIVVADASKPDSIKPAFHNVSVIYHCAADNKPNIGLLSGRSIRIASLMNSDAREMIELMYEFEEPLVLDGSKFSTEFPMFKYTSHEEGIRKTIDWFRQVIY